MKRTSALVMAMVLSACIPYPCQKTDRVRAPLEQESLDPGAKEKLKAGDAIATYTRKGQMDKYTVVAVEDAGFVGTAWDRKKYRVSYVNLDRMWVERKRWALCAITLW